MSNINTFVISGNLTRDPESRSTPTGVAVATYTVAVDTVHYRDGEKIEDTAFIPVSTYGKQAESDIKYLRKGALVAIQGYMRSWYDSTKKRGGIDFIADNVQYIRTKE